MYNNKLKTMSGKTKLFRIIFLFVFAMMVTALQAQTVKGNVVDQDGEPIIGASVVEKGNTRNGTVTDLDGNFTLQLKTGKKAVISYLGMISQEIGLGEGQHVVLKENSGELNEVVVLGYTSKARKDLTGSV